MKLKKYKSVAVFKASFCVGFQSNRCTLCYSSVIQHWQILTIRIELVQIDILCSEEFKHCFDVFKTFIGNEMNQLVHAVAHVALLDAV